MDMKQEHEEGLLFLEQTYMTERSKALLDFAKSNGYLSGTVTLPNGEVHAAATFAMQMYCSAFDIGKPADDAENEAYQIVCLMVVMEMCNKRNSSFGSKLLFKVRCSGIRLDRREVKAFLAQEGSFGTNRNKCALMENNLLAVSIHCGRLKALYNTLPSIGQGLYPADSSELQKLLETRCESDIETIEKLAMTYIPERIGRDNEKVVLRFLNWLRKTDHYSAPAAIAGIHCNIGGMAAQKVSRIYRTAELLLPATKAQIGEIVLAALLCDIHKINTFHPDEDGGFYFYDELPLGEGRKSLYMASGYFGDLIPDNVAEAIDSYLHDEDANPNVGLQMMEYPLGLYLHIGEMLAAFIPEVDENA